MGIINATNDSFYSKSRVGSIDIALARASEMIEQGATILDIGACSTRPGSIPVDEKTEISNSTPIIRALREQYKNITISIDTFRTSVASSAIDAGADIINDISGGDEDMLSLIKDSGKKYVLSHNSTIPYPVLEDNVLYIDRVIEWFTERVNYLSSMGIEDIIIDPGFGFGKTIEENYHLLSHLDMFNCFNMPILAGLSRKSMIYKPLDISPDKALGGTMVLNAYAISQGASILRVHDVKEASQVIKLVEMISNN